MHPANGEEANSESHSLEGARLVDTPSVPTPALRPTPELPWAETPMRALVGQSWPIVVSMLSYSTMTLADTFFVAGEGASALAGVGLGGTAAFVIFGFSFGLLRAVKILGAQARGAGAFDRERAALSAGILTSLVVGVVSIVLGGIAAFAMPLVAGSVEAGGHARDYLLIRALSSPVVLLYVALREARYGRGDSQSPMVAGVIANALNIVLDAVFVWGFDAGVRGVAWATFIASTAQAFLLLWTTWRSERRFVRPAWSDVRALFTVGAPTGVQFLLEIGSFSLLTILLARMPELELAAHQIAIQVIHFTFLPAIGVSETVSALVGQAIGARRLRLVGVVTNGGFAIVIAYAIFCSVMLLAFGHLVARGFTDDGALIARSAELLLIASLFQIADAAGVILRGTLRGAGDVKMPALIGIVCAWSLTPPLTWLIGIELGHGAVGGWLGLTAEIFVATAILGARYGRGQWLVEARRTRRLAQAVA